MLTSFTDENVWLAKSGRGWLRLASFVLVSMIALVPARFAAASSASSLVFVSVQMVETCSVDAIGGQTGTGVDLKMRCNSAARPAVGLESNRAAAGQPTPVGSVQMATTVTGARALSTVSLTPSADQMLRIDF